MAPALKFKRALLFSSILTLTLNLTSAEDALCQTGPTTKLCPGDDARCFTKFQRAGKINTEYKVAETGCNPAAKQDGCIFDTVAGIGQCFCDPRTRSNLLDSSVVPCNFPRFSCEQGTLGEESSQVQVCAIVINFRNWTQEKIKQDSHELDILVTNLPQCRAFKGDESQGGTCWCIGYDCNADDIPLVPFPELHCRVCDMAGRGSEFRHNCIRLGADDPLPPNSKVVTCPQGTCVKTWTWSDAFKTQSGKEIEAGLVLTGMGCRKGSKDVGCSYDASQRSLTCTCDDIYRRTPCNEVLHCHTCGHLQTENEHRCSSKNTDGVNDLLPCQAELESARPSFCTVEVGAFNRVTRGCQVWPANVVTESDTKWTDCAVANIQKRGDTCKCSSHGCNNNALGEDRTPTTTRAKKTPTPSPTSGTGGKRDGGKPGKGSGGGNSGGLGYHPAVYVVLTSSAFELQALKVLIIIVAFVPKFLY